MIRTGGMIPPVPSTNLGFEVLSKILHSLYVIFPIRFIIPAGPFDFHVQPEFIKTQNEVKVFFAHAIPLFTCLFAKLAVTVNCVYWQAILKKISGSQIVSLPPMR